MIREVEELTAAQAADWANRSTKILRKSEYKAALKKYDGYLQNIRLLKHKQAGVLGELQASSEFWTKRG